MIYRVSRYIAATLTGGCCGRVRRPRPHPRGGCWQRQKCKYQLSDEDEERAAFEKHQKTNQVMISQWNLQLISERNQMANITHDLRSDFTLISDLKLILNRCLICHIA